jgi:hypothetical protein
LSVFSLHGKIFYKLKDLLPWKHGQISGLSDTKFSRLGARSRRTNAHQKAHR